MSYTGFTLVSKDRCVSPTINLDLFMYHIYDTSVLVDEVHKSYQEALENMPTIDNGKIFTAEYIKENVFLKLVGTENNNHYYEGVVRQNVTEGLCLICCVMVSNDDGKGLASYKLSDVSLGNVGLSEDEILSCALKNTPKLFPAEFKSLAEIYSDLGVPEEAMPEFYRLTNSMELHGATAIFYPGQMLDVLEKLNCDSVYTIPSSVHEWLILKDDGSEDTVRNLRTRIREVNTYEVRDDDILSYNLYRYDRERGLHIA